MSELRSFLNMGLRVMTGYALIAHAGLHLTISLIITMGCSRLLIFDLTSKFGMSSKLRLIWLVTRLIIYRCTYSNILRMNDADSPYLETPTYTSCCLIRT